MKATDVVPMLRDSFDGSDPKGWALEWLFAIAEGLYLTGESVPESWEFSPSPFLSLGEMTVSEYLSLEYGIGDDVYAALTNDKFDGLRYVGNVLDRYLDMFVRGTDEDY